MGMIFKKVQNGDPDGNLFTAVPAAIVVPVFIVMLSALGAAFTWLLAASNERAAIASLVRTEVANAVTYHSAAAQEQSAEVIRRFSALEDRLAADEAHWSTVERQVNINTGIIEHRYPR